ncbi:MAG: hypothetical protein LBE12_14625 [Planctomycetaceae bacterium]|nr:hypothetical protein [Planctomycetaceae bacterium]
MKVLQFIIVATFLLGTLGFFGVTIAVNNQICRSLPGTGCSTVGTAACQENNGQMPSGCTSCSGTSALLVKVCVSSEGNDCTPLGPIPCGTTYYSGFCVQAPNGNWYCNQYVVPNQSCPGSLYACE